MRTVPTLLASLVTAATLAACGSSSSGSPATSAAPAASAGATTAAAGSATTAAGAATTAAGTAGTAGATITIDGFAYKTPEVAPGATVTVKNDDSVRHTVTADDNAFTVAVGKGTTGTFTAPAKAGSYAFHCAVHANMKGTLVVKG